MARIECSTLINAPLPAVFNYASAWQKWSDWFEGVSDFKPVDTVTSGNGARYAYKARMMGISVNVEIEIQDFINNHGWNGVSTKGMPHRTQWIFENQGEHTKFTYILEYQLPVPLIGSFLDSHFMQPQWERIINKSLDNLKNFFR
jgi:hypothetical protein